MSGPGPGLKSRAPEGRASDVLAWLAGRLEDPFVNVEHLPRYLAARREDGSVYLYGRLLTRAEADDIAAALPTLLGAGAAGLEAAVLSGDPTVASRALESANDDALTAMLHNPSEPVRASAMSQLEARAEPADDARLAELLTALERELTAVLEVTTRSDRRTLERVVRQGLTAKRRGAVRLKAIRCLLRLAPDARGEFSATPLAERLAAVDALAGNASLMDFLVDADEAVVAKARDGLAALPVEGVVAHALAAMKDGSPTQRLASVAAVEPFLVSRWRALLEPLVSLTKSSRGTLRVTAASALGRLAQARRLSRKHLERAVDALAAVPEERTTVSALRALMSGSPTADPLRAIELELDAGGTDESWAVYGDALLSAGDVRGELVATATDARKFKAVLKRHQATLFGALEDLLGKDLPHLLAQLTWRHGFIEGAVVHGVGDVSLEEVLDALLGIPVARFLSKLELGLSDPMGHDNDFAASIERLGDSGGAHLLRSLLLGRFDDEEAQMSWAPWGDVSALWAACPGLVDLRLRGADGPLGDVHAASLESLAVETGGLSRETLTAIAAAKLPALRHLEVWFGAEGYGGECGAADAERLLARKDPHLRSLGLRNAEFTHELIPLLAAWKPLRHLEVLDLSLGVLSDDDVDVLLGKRAAFAHLSRLDLRGNVLERRVKEIRKALPNAMLENQRETDGERYAAVGE